MSDALVIRQFCKDGQRAIREGFPATAAECFARILLELKKEAGEPAPIVGQCLTCYPSQGFQCGECGKELSLVPSPAAVGDDVFDLVELCRSFANQRLGNDCWDKMAEADRAIYMDDMRWALTVAMSKKLSPPTTSAEKDSQP